MTRPRFLLDTNVVIGLLKGHPATIRDLLDSVAVLPLDASIETAAIALRRQFRLKLPGALIGATARQHGLERLTLDRELAMKLHVARSQS